MHWGLVSEPRRAHPAIATSATRPRQLSARSRLGRVGGYGEWGYVSDPASYWRKKEAQVPMLVVEDLGELLRAGCDPVELLVRSASRRPSRLVTVPGSRSTGT